MRSRRRRPTGVRGLLPSGPATVRAAVAGWWPDRRRKGSEGVEGLQERRRVHDAYRETPRRGALVASRAVTRPRDCRPGGHRCADLWTGPMTSLCVVGPMGVERQWLGCGHDD
jgi:hypothetical protein